jgi:DNA invertase Pin-like site-specific DNA recombinase
MEKGIIKAALYARCSTHDKGQDPELQLSPLREYASKRGYIVAGEFVDYGISGTKERRPQLDGLMDAAKKRQVDIILVWKLDRFGRSLKQLVSALDELSGLGIGFVSYKDNIDLTTAQGRLMFHIIDAMAEFERELIKDRVKASLDNAKRKGKRLGRKPIPPVTAERVRALRAEVLSYRIIARKLGLSLGSVHKSLSNSDNGMARFV